jgi:DNA modification methylase
MTQTAQDPLADYLPSQLLDKPITDNMIPTLARDAELCAAIESGVQRVPTVHDLHLKDARQLVSLGEREVHLVITSPPYWTLKRYRDGDGQLGHLADYNDFLDALDEVWRQCYDMLVPGGRLICVVGDVCLSRRQNKGRHTVVPLHASIQEHCRQIGFDNLAPIIWHKIGNAAFEVDGGGGFLGKPYEPNAVIKNDIEFILMQRKPGGYRKPTAAARALSVIRSDWHKQWFQQIWTGVTGASTKHHPAPYPVTLAERLVRMFSFVGDTVMDPFLGSGTTSIAAGRCGRNSIGAEIDSEYFDRACQRIHAETRDLFGATRVRVFPGSEAA